MKSKAVNQYKYAMQLTLNAMQPITSVLSLRLDSFIKYPVLVGVSAGENSVEKGVLGKRV